MYNRLFYSILDSSIWLEPTPTRIVWITLLAAMDEDGFARFSGIKNLASRARVTETECQEAVAVLSSPDPGSSNPDNEGKRIEQVPGGFVVCNAVTYRKVINREIRREQTRIRVAKHRERLKASTSKEHNDNSLQNSNAESVTGSLPNVTSASEYESSSVLYLEEKKKEKELAEKKEKELIQEIYLSYPRKVGKPTALRAIARMSKKYGAEFLLAKTLQFDKSQIPGDTYTPHPATWFNDERFNDDPTTWVHANGKEIKPKTDRDLAIEQRMEAARGRKHEQNTH